MTEFDGIKERIETDYRHIPQPDTSIRQADAEALIAEVERLRSAGLSEAPAPQDAERAALLKMFEGYQELKRLGWAAMTDALMALVVTWRDQARRAARHPVDHPEAQRADAIRQCADELEAALRAAPASAPPEPPTAEDAS